MPQPRRPRRLARPRRSPSCRRGRLGGRRSCRQAACPASATTLLGYARDTWASFVAMTDPTTGLPADSLTSDGTPASRPRPPTSARYMWSTLVAERLGIIGHDEAVARLDTTLDSLETMERHQPTASTTTGTTTTPAQKLTVGRRPASR